MTWFLNFIQLSTRLIGAWLGPLILVSAGCVFALGVWGLWKSADRRSRWHDRKWAPPLILCFASMLAGFHNLMNLAGDSMGDTRRFTSGPGAGYVPLELGTLQGMTPEQAFLALLGAFVPFFAVVGACICYRGLIAAVGVAKGTRRHGWGVPATLLVFGSLIARLDLVAAALVSLKNGLGS